MDCDEFSDVAAELALGVLAGRERADALAHLERCDACRETVRQLAMTGEELVELLPAAEPPAGFETRVLDRIGIAPGAPPRRRACRLPSVSRLLVRPWRRQQQRRQPRRLLVGGAPPLAVIAAGLGGWGLGTAASPAHSQVSASAPNHVPLSSGALVTANHQSVGTAFYYSGAKPWMYMSVDVPLGNGTVTCQLQGPNGHYTTVGSFRVTAGYGAWGGPSPWPGAHVTGARILGPDGKVLATARFS